MAEAARLDDLADSLPPPAAAADVGGDADAGVAAEPAEAQPAAESPSTSPDDGVDPLDRLLREYDDRNGNGAAASDDDIIALLDQDAARQQQEQDFQAAQQRFDADSAQSAMALAQRDRQLGELQQTVGQLQQAIAAEQFRQHQQRSFEDFKRLTADEQAKLEGLDVPENHVETFLLAEAARDPELQRAWEGKYYQPPGPVERARVASHIQQWAEGQARLALQLPDRRARVLAQQNIEASMRQMWETAFPDPAAYRANAAQYVQRALDRMHKEARRPRIDERISGDVLAVAQAVRGASGKPPPEPPVDLTRMTQGEFQRHTMEKYGF